MWSLSAQWAAARAVPVHTKHTLSERWRQATRSDWEVWPLSAVCWLLTHMPQACCLS